MAQTVSTSSLSPQSFYQSTLSGSITSSDTTIPINSLPTANEGYLVLESTSSTAREIIHYTSKTGSAVVCGAVGDRGLFGTTAQAHSSGALVEDNWVTGYWLDLQSQVATTSATTLQRHLANPTEGQFGNNFVSSGYGLTGASSSLVATLASGVAYVAGSRVLAAVGGHTYPANSDIFVDVNSSGSLTFVGGGSSTLSGASVPITSNSIRLARVNTHATGINQIFQNNFVSVNASNYYGGYSRDGSAVLPYINQKSLGVAKITGNFSTASASAVQVTGLSVNVTLPSTTPAIRIKAYASNVGNSSASTISYLTIWDGAVGTGTLIAQAQTISIAADAANGAGLVAEAVLTPGTGQKTYNVGLHRNGGTAQINASTGIESFISVEQI